MSSGWPLESPVQRCTGKSWCKSAVSSVTSEQGKKQKRVQRIVEDPDVQKTLKKKVQNKRALRDIVKVEKAGLVSWSCKFEIGRKASHLLT